MLGRCRLRRGVSLEVIVEEDDTAEVTLDPTPLEEEDEEDEDDDDDDDSGRGARGSSAASEGEGGSGGGGGGGGEAMAAEERRRRRERRRTIGGLSRIRSVSCEALTLLDTSDMDNCYSEWDDEDDLATTSSNYVTLNRPISRRRILESTQSQCDSEDSGIEYHSNEDDPTLEDRSSAEDHCHPPDIHEAETATESEGDEEEQEVSEEAERGVSSSPSPTEEDVSTLSSSFEEESVLSTSTGKRVSEDRRKGTIKKDSTSAAPCFAPNEALENDKVVIVETTPSVPTRRPSQEGSVDPAEEELQLKAAAYTIRNKEVRLAELPRPDTVRSVKQLFEENRHSVHHFHTWRDLGRFRDIKSNPSSKILRFDRSDTGGDCLRRGQGLREGSQTLPRLPSQTGIRVAHGNTSSSSSTHRPQDNVATTVPLMAELRQHQAAQRTLGGSSSQPRIPKSPSKLGSVVLRKPVVRGFNVKKALMEDPKSFLPHSHESKKHKEDMQRQTKVAMPRHRHTHIYTRTQHHSDFMDRSDTESLASDLSDDSGVSNDSTVSSAASTSATSTTYRALDAYAADPSFKWIDPSVMAKIRAVGTTVIFFGPRPRPRSQDGTLTKGVKGVSSGLQPLGGAPLTSKGRTCRSGGGAGLSVHFEDLSRSVSAAPRIVGVVRKRTPSTSSTGGSGHPTPSATPTPSDLFSDESRASSPGRSGDARWRAEKDHNTVVYDFTRSHAQPGWV